MARGLNSITLVGTLTQAPELKYTAGGLAILELNVAGSDHVLGDDNQERDLAWYHRVTVFAKQAEYLVDQLAAGSPVFVEGALDYRSWDDPSGQKRSSLDIKGLRVQPLTVGPRKGEATVQDVKGQERLKNALNQVSLIGNLTRDAELRYTPTGNAVTSLSIAVNDQFQDRSGNQQERTHFVDITFWRELAEGCAELRKGDPIFAMGRLMNENWTDKDGNRRYRTKVEGTRVEFLTRGPGGGGTVTRSAPQQDVRAGQARVQPKGQPLDIDEEFPPEEDLPF